MQQGVWQQKWVIGNWKMNGSSAQNTRLLEEICALPQADKVCVGVAPPALYLAPTAAQLAAANSANPICLSAQMASRFNGSGAYTGEISAPMLADVGVKLVLVGHSERSLYFAETAEQRRSQLEHILAAGLQPLLCVGESLAQREAEQHFDTVAAQLAVLKDLSFANGVAVAYEPVWAIGTGKTATPEQIGEMHQFIYDTLLSLLGGSVNIRILYGGSVNDQNAAAIFRVAHVDGALVGGASLKSEAFAAIIRAAQETD